MATSLICKKCGAAQIGFPEKCQKCGARLVERRTDYIPIMGGAFLKNFILALCIAGVVGVIVLISRIL
jgi:hypothetical protein